MQTGLKWTLGLTVLLAAWAQWWPRSQPTVVAATVQLGAKPLQPVVGTTPGPTTGSRLKVDLLAAEVEALQPWTLEPAGRDPFVALPVATPLAAAPPQVVVAPAAPAPQTPLSPPPAAAPPVTALRYLGALFNPNGERLLLLADGEVVVTAQPGTALPNGYVVQSVALDAVRVAHPPTGAAIDISLPSVVRGKP